MVEMVECLFSSSSIYDKIVLACKKYNQPLQRTVTLKNKVSAIMKSEKHNPFDLNRTEYADLLGVSPNCIRMRLRQKKLEGQYIFENGKYFEAWDRDQRKYSLQLFFRTAAASANLLAIEQ